MLGLTTLAPVATQAQGASNVAVGTTAIVANTGGAGVLLRDNPSYDGAVVLSLAEGTSVEITTGQRWDGTGNAWLGINFWGTTGFLPEVFLQGTGQSTQQPASAPAEAAAMPPGIPDTTVILDPGTGLITNTNNDGVRCRVQASYAAEVITVVPEGTVVWLADPVLLDVWQPIICGERYGYVHTDFMTYSATQPTPEPEVVTEAPPVEAVPEETVEVVAEETLEADTAMMSAAAAPGFGADAVTGYATVVGTNGDGVRCRADASYSANTITVLAEGLSVALRGQTVGEWTAVVCAGVNGFAHSSFIGSGNNAAPPAESPALEAAAGAATVVGTNGGGLNCRSAAGYGANVIAVLAEGSSVSVRGVAQGEWLPVTCAGLGGFAHTAFLSLGGGNQSGPPPASNPTTPSAPGTVTGYAKVFGTNGGGLRCRAEASYNGAVIAVMPEGSTVSVRGSVQGEWMPVVCANTNGFAHASFLTQSNAPSNPPPANPAPTAAPTTAPQDPDRPDRVNPGFAIGTRVKTTASLNLRYQASFSAGVAAVTPSGTVVEIVDGPANGFYRVNWDGLYGWMYQDYLVWTNEALSKRGGSAPTQPQQPSQPAPTSQPAPPSGNNGSPSGSAIVNFAMQYVGYPYVWAGAGPYAFDCSGFTMYVIRNVLGRNITHDMHIQYAQGMPVSRNNLQPGDIVFFQNTFQWGLSHVGIYIGGGRFVHAENPSTGVVVSDLNSTYYSTRWYGAVRYS